MDSTALESGVEALEEASDKEIPFGEVVAVRGDREIADPGEIDAPETFLIPRRSTKDTKRSSLLAFDEQSIRSSHTSSRAPISPHRQKISNPELQPPSRDLVSCLSFQCREFMFESERAEARRVLRKAKGWERKRSRRQFKASTVKFHEKVDWHCYNEASRFSRRSTRVLDPSSPQARSMRKKRGFTGLNVHLGEKPNFEEVIISKQPLEDHDPSPEVLDYETLKASYMNLCHQKLGFLGNRMQRKSFVKQFISVLHSALINARQQLQHHAVDKVDKLRKEFSTPGFREDFNAFVVLSCLNRALKNGTCGKLFTHKFVSCELNEETLGKKSEDRAEIFLKMINKILRNISNAYRHGDKDESRTSGVKFKESNVPEWRRIIINQLPIDDFMEEIRQGAQDAFHDVDVGLSVEPSNSKNQIDAFEQSSIVTMWNNDTARSYMDDDAVSEECETYVNSCGGSVPDSLREMKAISLPGCKRELKESLLSCDFVAFLVNRNNALFFQRSMFAINYMRVCNVAVSLAIINSNTPILHSFMSRPVPENVKSVLATITQCYVDKLKSTDKSYASLSEGGTEKKMAMVLNAFSGTDHNLRLFLKLKKSALFGRNKPKLVASCYNYMLNPVVRADLQFSERRLTCKARCKGHRGGLLLTVIRSNNPAMLEFLLNHGVHATLKVCQGPAKSLGWTDSFEGFESQSKSTTLTTKSSQGLIAKVLRFFKSLFTSVFGLRSSQKHSRTARKHRQLQLNDEDDLCIMQRTRYRKITPLAVALQCFQDSLQSVDKSERNVTYKVLMDYGAKVDPGSEDFLRIMMNIDARLEPKQRPKSLYLNDEGAVTFLLPEFTKEESKRQAVADVDLELIQFRQNIWGSFRSLGSFSQQKRTKGGLKSLEDIVLRSGMLYTALLDRNYANFRALLPVSTLNSAFKSKEFTAEFQVSGSFSDDNEADVEIGELPGVELVDSGSDQILELVVKWLVHEFGKNPLGKRIHLTVLIQAVYFLMTEYSFVVSNDCWVVVLSCLSGTINHEIALSRRTGFCNSFDKLVKSDQVQAFLGLRTSYFKKHQGEQQQLDKDTVKIRQQVTLACFQLGLLDTFKELIKPDVVNLSSSLKETYSQTLLERFYTCDLITSLETLNTALQIDVHQIVERIFEECIHQWKFLCVVDLLLEHNYLPASDHIDLFIVKVLMDLPRSLNLTDYEAKGYILDHSKLAAFFKLLGPCFDIECQEFSSKKADNEVFLKRSALLGALLDSVDRSLNEALGISTSSRSIVSNRSGGGRNISEYSSASFTASPQMYWWTGLSAFLSALEKSKFYSSAQKKVFPRKGARLEVRKFVENHRRLKALASRKLWVKVDYEVQNRKLVLRKRRKSERARQQES